MPAISIIIPTFNCRDQLERLLNSIDRQTFRDFEVIVVDNDSKDGTFDLASQRTRAYQRGPEIQKAFGADQACGDYLMFFEADMELDSMLLENCFNLGRQGCDAAIIPERGRGEGFWANCRKLEMQCHWNNRWMEAANRFIQRGVYLRIGGYRTDLLSGEDFELHDRLVDSGARIGRSLAILTHDIDTGFWGSGKNKFYYFTKIKGISKKTVWKNIKRFVLSKPAYFRNWKLLLGSPILTLGLILMKGAQFIAGFLGKPKPTS